MPLNEVILTGGAARSKLWPQILADVLGRAIRVPDSTESAATGAAAVAALAVGMWPYVANPAGPALPPARVARPVPAQRQAYEDLYGQWLRRNGNG
jgi:autoinducer 2 (AI-2) kinase